MFIIDWPSLTKEIDMDNTHQINNSLAKIKIIYELIKDSKEKNEEYLKSLEVELERVKKIIYSLRCSS